MLVGAETATIAAVIHLLTDAVRLFHLEVTIYAQHSQLLTVNSSLWTVETFNCRCRILAVNTHALVLNRIASPFRIKVQKPEVGSATARFASVLTYFLRTTL